ncbi:uncharacterized protein LOC128133686 [Lactuca sativa]|uniref:uncharacterized protein LOC128133686 n=1 Tax=Lactuca sativa TaxID=4236 RepID=UPI0022B0761D|nr:uncharacterized protein LOC128133686 [Lactuca sativa]
MSRNRPTQPLHMDHGSSPQALHAGNPSPSNSRNRAFSQNNRGGRRSSEPRRGGSHSTDNRRPSGTTTTIPSLPSGFPWPPYPIPWNPYTLLYPSWQQLTRPTSTSYQPMRNQQPGVLGTAPNSGLPTQRPPEAAFFAAPPHQNLVPPAQWFPPLTPDEPTDITQALNSMHINDGLDTQWYMDTGATTHLPLDTGKVTTFGKN